VEWVLRKLLDADMRVSQEKSNQGGLRNSPEKVKAMKQFPVPKTLFELISFLRLASYYRCFIKDFATIARPLTNILKGENGKADTNISQGKSTSI